MFSDSSAFVIDFEGCAYGVSARRIFEHMMLGQINPFSRLVSSVQSPAEAAEVIDLISGHPDSYSLTGLTLSALYDGTFTQTILGDDEGAVRGSAEQATPLRQNSCRSDMMLILGAIRTNDGSVWRSIQKQSSGAVVAAGERQYWRSSL